MRSWIIAGFVTSLTLGAITIQLIALPSIKSSQDFSKSKNEKPPASGPTDSTPVVVVNSILRNRYGSIMSAGYGSGDTQDRRLAELAFREGRLEDALRLFQSAVETDPSDLRCQLGLGKTHLERGEYAKSIKPLSVVRMECHRFRCAHKAAPYSLSSPINYGDLPVLGVPLNNLDQLPEQACDALDYEARAALEEAVLAHNRPCQKRGSPALANRPKDRNYKILKNALALARGFHREGRLEELSSMYILASETSRSTSYDLIIDCMVTGSLNEKWDQLARLTLNAKTRQEKEWYQKYLSRLSTRLKDDDIRKAATIHYMSMEYARQGIEATTDLESVRQTLQKLDGIENIERYRANCAYNLGYTQFQDGTYLSGENQLIEPEETFLPGTQNLSKNADAIYNAGIMHCARGNYDQAIGLFQRAAHLYYTSNQLKSASLSWSNACALALENVTVSEYHEPFFRYFDDSINSEESASLRGIYLFKRGKFDEAIEPLRRASEAQRKREIYSTEALPNDSEAILSQVIESSKSDANNDQVLELLFARLGPIERSVKTRFGSVGSEEGIGSANHLTSIRNRNYDEVVNILYQKALQRTNRLDELKAYRDDMARLGRSTGYTDRDYKTEDSYRELISGILSDTWFAPEISQGHQIVVRMSVTKDGLIRVRSIEPVPGLIGGQLRATVVECLTWASHVTPPPANLADRELIVVFNCQADESNCGAAFPMTCGRAASSQESEEW